MLVPDQAGKGFAKRGIAEAQEKFGVAPEAIIDYLAMIGDSADNIPGIAGVGPKTATELLLKYGSLDGVYENIENITKKALKENKELLDLLAKSKYKQQVYDYYNVEELTLYTIAQSRNWILKADSLDTERTAKYILKDFREGRLGKFILDEIPLI